MTIGRIVCRDRLRLSLAMCVVVLLVAVIILIENNAIIGLKYTDNIRALDVGELNKGSTDKSIGHLGAGTASKTSVSLPRSMKVDINHFIRNSNKSSPLYDYVSFPCTERLQPFPKADWDERGICVRTINASHHADSVTSDECVKMKTPAGPTRICIHNVRSDVHVSGSLKRNGGWEYDLVTSLCKKLLSFPRMEFLDLGCNIGVYSLSVARAGRPVVCIDPLVRNLQLVSKSVSLDNLRDNVTLIWNAVSNDYSEMGFKFSKGNIGGTHVKEVTRSISNPTSAHDHANAIRLDDLTPLFKGKQLGIKMDVESHELKVLQGGMVFFNQVDVRFIQMEIFQHRATFTGPMIAAFLRNHTFLPYKDINGRTKLDPKQIKRWPNDVYFIKTV